MKAIVLAWAARVNESAFGRLWWQAGDVLDVVIPIALFFAVVAGAGAVMLGLVH